MNRNRGRRASSRRNGSETLSCRECGACCSYSREWPRFSTETEADLARIPSSYVDDDCGRMKCHGERCSALQGEVGVVAFCAIYQDRPEVCRSCVAGDDACLMARREWGL